MPCDGSNEYMELMSYVTFEHCKSNIHNCFEFYPHKYDCDCSLFASPTELCD